MHFNTDEPIQLLWVMSLVDICKLLEMTGTLLKSQEFPSYCRSTDGGTDNANQLHGTFIDVNDSTKKAA